MRDDLEGMLEDDVLALLREAKEVPELSAATKTKLFADVAARVVLPPPGGGGDGGGTDAPSAPTAPGPAASAASTGFAVTTGKAVAALATTFAIGMASGVAVDRGLTTAPPRRRRPSRSLHRPPRRSAHRAPSRPAYRSPRCPPRLRARLVRA